MLKNDKWSLLHGPHIIFIFLAILCIYRILVSDLIPINWDGPLFIDGSYRVYLGHIPNKDFSVPIGPLIFLSGGLGMKLTTPSILGMNVGFVIYILVIALVLIYMLWPDLKRKVQVADILFFGVIFLLLLSPKVLGGKPYNLAYTGFYNNISYAILFATCYFLLASNACQDSKRNFLLGHVLGHLIFIKLIFFLATALICFLFLMTYRRKQLVTVSLGILSTLAILIFIEGGLTFFIRDQLYVSYLRMSENPYFSGERLWNFFKHTWLEVLIFLVLLYSSRKKEAPIFFTGLLLFFVEYFLSMAIMQKPVHMTSVLFAMLLLKYAPDTEDARTLIVRFFLHVL